MRLNGQLITVRTSRQGAAMEKGKFTPEYLEEISSLTLNPEDLDALGLDADKKALLETAEGAVTVTCRPADVPRGLFFLPLGAVANTVIGGETHGTGVPDFKGVAAVVSRAEPQA